MYLMHCLNEECHVNAQRLLRDSLFYHGALLSQIKEQDKRRILPIIALHSCYRVPIKACQRHKRAGNITFNDETSSL